MAAQAGTHLIQTTTKVPLKAINQLVVQVQTTTKAHKVHLILEHQVVKPLLQADRHLHQQAEVRVQMHQSLQAPQQAGQHQDQHQHQEDQVESISLTKTMDGGDSDSIHF